MKNSKYYLMMVLISLSSFSVNTVDSNEAGKPASAHSQDHGTWKERRFVVPVDADGVQRAEMVGGDYFYEPNSDRRQGQQAGGVIPHLL